jgi:CheY-like chemotaxis protein
MNCSPTIHVVDDDQAMRESLQLLLTLEGYAVHTHASARTILETIQDTDRGCIVTDMHMPEISGLDLLVALNERRVSLPVTRVWGANERTAVRRERPMLRFSAAGASLICRYWIYPAAGRFACLANTKQQRQRACFAHAWRNETPQAVVHVAVLHSLIEVAKDAAAVEPIQIVDDGLSHPMPVLSPFLCRFWCILDSETDA